MAASAAHPEVALPREKALTVVRSPDLPGIEAVRGRGVAADIIRHAHGRLVVGLCLSGVRRIVFGRESWTVAAGQGFVIPPGLPHACGAANSHGHSYLVLAVDPALCPAAAPDGGAWPGQGVRLFEQGAAAGLVVRLGQALAHGDGEALPLWERLARILDLRLPPRPAAHPATLRARAAIDAAPEADHSLAALARLAGVSPFHLERLFARDYGVPVGEYVLARRVGLAAAGIAAGLPLAEAALAAGFCDQSHLCRQFRRRMGVPPGCYREGGEEEEASGGREGVTPSRTLRAGG